MESPQDQEQTQPLPPPPPTEDEWDKVAKAHRAETQTDQQSDAEHPVRSFWDRLVHGNEDQSKLQRTGEVARSGARGAVGAVKEAQQTTSELAGALGRPDLAYAAKLGSKLTDKVQQLFGKKSDDPLASFTESAVQFATSYAATEPLAAVGGATKVARVLNAAGRGALVDATAFNPNDAGLAELVARIPVPGIRDLGKALSVNPTDPETIKRFKRGAAGVLPAIAIDTFVAGAQRVWANTVGKTAPDAVKISAEAGKTLQDIADGTHVPDGAHVKVEDAGDGTFTLKPVHEDLQVEKAVEGPRFSDRAEAEAQAGTINNAMTERLNAAEQGGGLTHQQAEDLRGMYRSYLTAPDKESLDALTNGTHFNFSYINEPKNVLSQIEAVSKVFKEELDNAQITDGVTVAAHAERVTQFLDGLAPEQAPALLSHMLKNGSQVPQSIVLNAADVVLRDVATKTANLFDVVTARPHDVIAWEEARLASGNLVNLQEALAGANSEAGRSLKFLQDRDAVAEAVGKAKAAPKVEAPVEGAAPKVAPEPKTAAAVAGMDKAKILGVLKMAKMAGGSPAKLAGIRPAAAIIQETGFLRRAVEFFVNAALSNPVTHATALTMNTMVSTYEAASKMFTGAVTANSALAREGWDTLVANELFLRDNFSTAMMAFRKGQSVINPGEVHNAIPGAIGDVIRTPGKGLLFTDEFTRVTNYRSFIYAKSLRFWRERGLDGQALASAVSRDVKDAFDAKTGVAVIPDALKYAEVPTMSGDLGRESLGGSLASLLNNHVEAKFIAPFVKTSVNVFRYTFDRTPGLNLLAKRNREIIAAGGEAAAVLHTQSVIATGVATYAYMKAKSGEVTGSGPKDPQLRQMWMNDHKPYSIKIDGNWVSYRRLDPLLTPVSLMADVHDMVQELSAGGRDHDAETIISGSLAGIAAAFANKTYMTGMTQFFEAWSGGKGDMMKKWLQGFGTTFTDPQLLRAVNDDPYLREVVSMKDAMMSGIPGLSEKLPARYNVFGEPVLATHSFMPANGRGSAEQTVATDLFNLGKGIPPLTRNSLNGVPVDLTNTKFGKVEGLSAYEYAQKKIREPGDGDPSLKKALGELVKSSDWKEASPGSEMYPGGERYIMAYRIIDSYRRQALGDMLDRFPLIQREVEMQRQAKGASVSEGQQGLLNTLREYGKK